jgi:hypothetical protein
MGCLVLSALARKMHKYLTNSFSSSIASGYNSASMLIRDTTRQRKGTDSQVRHRIGLSQPGIGAPTLPSEQPSQQGKQSKFGGRIVLNCGIQGRLALRRVKLAKIAKIAGTCFSVPAPYIPLTLAQHNQKRPTFTEGPVVKGAESPGDTELYGQFLVGKSGGMVRTRLLGNLTSLGKFRAFPDCQSGRQIGLPG